MKKIDRFLSVFLFCVFLFGVSVIAEEITLTTYYPAPYGAYNELSTTGNTYLATTSGNAVGIGTTDPGTYRLKVNGTIDATAYSVGGTTAGTTGNITYVKNVIFVATPPSITVTTGTITITNGIVTVID